MTTNQNLSYASDWMWIAMMWIGVPGLRAFYGAWFTRETDARFIKVMTQRKRYFFTLLATVICFVPVMALIHAFGWTTFATAAHSWTNGSDGNFGRAIDGLISFSLYFGLLSPIWGLITAAHVYRKPSLMARKVRDGYISTNDARRKSDHSLRVYRAESIRLMDASVERKFV